jgi:hypothetical protein
LARALLEIGGEPIVSDVAVEMARLGTEESLAIARPLIADARMSDTSRSLALALALEHYPAGDPRARELVIATLRKNTGDLNLVSTRSMLAKGIGVASEEVADFLRVYAQGPGRKDRKFVDLIREAVDLKLRPPNDADAHLAAWLKALRRSQDEWEIASAVLWETVRAVPRGAEPKARVALRAAMEAPLHPEALRALQALGDPLTEDERNRLAEYDRIRDSY